MLWQHVWRVRRDIFLVVVAIATGSARFTVAAVYAVVIAMPLMLELFDLYVNRT